MSRRKTLKAHFAPYRPRPAAGFTLVELMIAVALSALLMGMVSMVFFQAGTVTAGTDAKVVIHTEARFILEKMAMEIAAAQRRTGLNLYFRGVQHGTGNGYYDTTRNYRRDGIGFVMTDPERGQVLVCYWLNMDDSSGSSPRGLVRYTKVVDAADRSANNPFPVLDTDPADGDIGDSAGADWHYMSENAVSLEFRHYYDEDGDGRVNEDPANIPGYCLPDGVDNDQDGVQSEDPTILYATSFSSEGPFYWQWASNTSFPHLPTMVEIRIVFRDTENRERRLFSRIVAVLASRDR
jgi:prepilin-type N-terminal cleavage/methylation domain-containing protein